MIETFTFCSDTPCQIHMLVTRTAQGVIVQMLGGDEPHIGATVISHPRPSLADQTLTSCNSIVIPELGHKEDELAKPLAEKIATTLNCPVVFVAGIHVHNACPATISRIIQSCQRLVDEFLASVKTGNRTESNK